MKVFIERTAEQLSLKVCNQGGLSGFAPFFSCPDVTRTFEMLKKGLEDSTAESGNVCHWLTATNLECTNPEATCSVDLPPAVVEGYVGLQADTNPSALVTKPEVKDSIGAKLAEDFNVPADTVKVTVGTGPLGEVSLLTLRRAALNGTLSSLCTVYATYAIVQTDPPTLDEVVVTETVESVDATKLESDISTAVSGVAPEVGRLKLTQIRACDPFKGGVCKDKKLREDVKHLVDKEAPSSTPRTITTKDFFRRLYNWPSERKEGKCGLEWKQRANYFTPTYNPTLQAQPASGFNSSIEWQDFTRANWTYEHGGVYAAWSFQMGIPGQGGSALPGGYLGAQMKNEDVGALLFSVLDGDRTTGSGNEKNFKASNSLVWPLTDKVDERQPGQQAVICQRNCQDCSGPQLQEAKKQGFTTGTQCHLIFNDMIRGGQWDLQMHRLRSKVTINTRDYQGMPKAHEAVGEKDRDITGAEWEVVLSQKESGTKIEVGKILFEGSADMGISRLEMFDEMLGCNKCDDVYHKNTRVGPFIEDGRVPEALEWENGAPADDESTPQKPCKRARAYKGKTKHSVTLEVGPPVLQDESLAWGKRRKIY